MIDSFVGNSDKCTLSRSSAPVRNARGLGCHCRVLTRSSIHDLVCRDARLGVKLKSRELGAREVVGAIWLDNVFEVQVEYVPCASVKNDLLAFDIDVEAVDVVVCKAVHALGCHLYHGAVVSARE